MIEWPFIEITNVCNMHCQFCPQDTHKRTRLFMPETIFREAVDQIAELHPLRPIQLQVLGEPLLHPKIFNYIDYIGDKGLSVILFTNGGKITDHIAEICRCKSIVALVLSLQTPTEDTYRLRGCTKPFHKYLDDIYFAIEYAMAHRVTDHMRIEIHLANTKHIPFRDWAVLEDNEIARSTMQQIATRIAGKEADISTIPANALDVTELDWWGYEAAPNVYVRLKTFGPFAWARLPEKYEISECREARQCDFMKNIICILSNGDITSCCLDIEADMRLGNIRYTRLKDAMRSHKRAALLEDATLLASCRRCLGTISKR